MPEVALRETCDAPLEVVFAYVADFPTIPEWMGGVRKLEPVTEQDYGLGSEFDVSLQLGLPLDIRIRTVEFEERRVIGMQSVTGFDARSRWQFETLGGDRTAVAANVAYDLPFGPAGRAMGMVMEPFVKQAVSHVSHHLRVNVERLARP
jgi:uncharacterized membrane protein